MFSLKRKRNKLPENPASEPKKKAVGVGRFPPWLHRKLPKGGGLSKTHKAVGERRLATVCEEAKCPNLLECYSKKTATFLVMGRECTRACGFCDILTNKAPPKLEEDEPLRVAESAKELGLKHVVITMVARDDLPDGGAAHLVRIVDTVREVNPGVTIELLTSDFEGNQSALDLIIDVQPDVFNHNIETVESLTPRVRHKATYQRSLEVLKYVKEKRPTQLVKSGIMVGLGEDDSQVEQTLKDLHEIGCDIVTIGQYLQPSLRKLRVKRFVTPETFALYEKMGKNIGIPSVYSGPFVRSSYNAGQFLRH